MPTPAFPTSTELQQFLTDAGLYSGAPTFTNLILNAATAAASAVASDTGYVPFIASAIDSTRKFTLERSRRLDLGAGLASLTSVAHSGAILTSGTDFWLEPPNALDLGLPYEVLVFRSRRSSLEQAVAVTGKWGYIASDAAMPQWAFDAALYKGAMIVSPTLSGAAGDLVAETYKDVRYQYATGAESGSQFGRWSSEYDRIMGQHRRAVIE